MNIGVSRRRNPGWMAIVAWVAAFAVVLSQAFSAAAAGSRGAASNTRRADSCAVSSPIGGIISFPLYADTQQEICGMNAVEDWAYEMYADIHGYPVGDPRIAETGYPVIAGYIEGILEQISYLEANDPSTLTPDEQGAYDWLEAVDETFQVRAAQDAVNEYNKWQNAGCKYQPPNVALFSYDTSNMEGCSGNSSLGTLFEGPTPPSYQEFVNYGIYDANQEMGQANPLGSGGDQQTIIDGITAGIGGSAAIIGGVAPQLIDSLSAGSPGFINFLKLVRPHSDSLIKLAKIRGTFIDNLSDTAKVNATEAELQASGEADQELVSLEEGEGINFQDAGVDAAAEAAAEGADALSGPFAIAMIGVTIGVMEGVKVITAAKIPQQLQDNLTSAKNAQARTDVQNLIDDNTGAGYGINLQNFEAQLNLPYLTIGNSRSGACPNCVVYDSPPTPAINAGGAIRITALDPQSHSTNWTWTSQTVENIDTWPVGVDQGWNGFPEESISILNGVAWTKQQAGYQATDSTADGLRGYLPSGEIRLR